MSTFTRDDVLQLAGLARLELTDAETALFTRQLANILEFVREIQAVDVSTVATPAGGADPGEYRDDTVQPSLDAREVLGAGPDTEAGLFKVPRVFNG